MNLITHVKLVNGKSRRLNQSPKGGHPIPREVQTYTKIQQRTENYKKHGQKTAIFTSKKINGQKFGNELSIFTLNHVLDYDGKLPMYSQTVWSMIVVEGTL